MAIALAAVTVLEASELTNSGRGSVLNVHGEVECDAAAAIAPGPRGPPLFGAVGAVQRLEHPAAAAVSVARRGGGEESGGLVLPLLLVGVGAEEDAETMGHKLCEPDRLVTAQSRERFARHSRLATEMRTDAASGGGAHETGKRRRVEPHLGESTVAAAPGTDTVGAVATDREGRCASVVSSGGISLKKRGRIGQAASQAGAYAGAAGGTSVAVVSTGVGEELMRTQLAAKCGELVVGGNHLHAVAERLTGDLFLRSTMLGAAARRECGIVAVASHREAGGTRCVRGKRACGANSATISCWVSFALLRRLC
jgi:isoaspartyl peptidase/L-asparaginase-like protein (Ntn-hydrolase superfamily)